MIEGASDLAGVVSGVVATGASLLAELLTTKWENEADALKAMEEAADRFFQAVGEGRDLWKARLDRRRALLADIEKGKAEDAAQAEAEKKAREEAEAEALRKQIESEQGC